jgi:hypothetical protein
MMMIKKKSMIFILVTILGFPQIALAENLIKVNTLVNDHNSLEKTEDNLLLTRRGHRRGSRGHRARRSRRGIRREHRSGYRRGRRSEFRDEVRDYRRRDRALDVVGGITAIGIGAAIADSNEDDGSSTQVIINDHASSLQGQEYYDDLYDCQDLDQGGYYDSCR